MTLNLRSKLRPLLIAGTTAIAVAAFTASSAQAAPPAPSKGCPANHVCVYEHANFRGSSLVVPAERLRGKRYVLSAYNLKDKVSSWKNTSSELFCLLYDVRPFPWASPRLQYDEFLRGPSEVKDLGAFSGDTAEFLGFC